MAWENYGATYLKLLRDMKQNQYASRGQFRSDILGMAKGLGDRRAEQGMQTERIGAEQALQTQKIGAEQGMQTERIGAEKEMQGFELGFKGTEGNKEREAEKAKLEAQLAAAKAEGDADRAAALQRLLEELKYQETPQQRKEREIAVELLSINARSAAEKPSGLFLQFLQDESQLGTGIRWDATNEYYLKDEMLADPELMAQADGDFETWLAQNVPNEDNKNILRDQWSRWKGTPDEKIAGPILPDGITAKDKQNYMKGEAPTPEVQALADKLWQELPKKYKYGSTEDKDIRKILFNYNIPAFAGAIDNEYWAKKLTEALNKYFPVESGNADPDKSRREFEEARRKAGGG